MDINHLVCRDDQNNQATLPDVSSLDGGCTSMSASSSLESAPSRLYGFNSLPPVASLTSHVHAIFGQSRATRQVYPSRCTEPPFFSQDPGNSLASISVLVLPLAAPEVGQQQGDHQQQHGLMRSSVGAQQQRVECSLCGKSFSGISSHNRHVSRTHHKARPFSCASCGLQFGQKGSLDRHTAAVHLKARPFTCDHCGKGFGRKDNMKIHMTTVHLKKKPYKCDICPKSFGGKRPLKIHRQTVHFKQRPLQCPYCDKRFGQRSNLNVHLKVHKRAGTLRQALSTLPTSPIGSMDDLGSMVTQTERSAQVALSTARTQSREQQDDKRAPLTQSCPRRQTEHSSCYAGSPI